MKTIIEHINEALVAESTINESISALFTADNIFQSLSDPRCDIGSISNREEYENMGGVVQIHKFLERVIDRITDQEETTELYDLIDLSISNKSPRVNIDANTIAAVTKITGFKRWYLTTNLGCVQVHEIKPSASASDVKLLSELIEAYHKMNPKASKYELLVKNF